MTATVVKIDKAECLAVAEVANPAAESDFLSRKSRGVLINGTDKISFHNNFLFFENLLYIYKLYHYS